MLTSELIRDVDALDEWRGQWDELAVDAGRPFCSPGWMLAWWSDAAPARSELAVVIVREARTLLGLAPWYVDRTPLLVPRVRALASGTCMRAEPLARPGRQAEAAEAFANTLARETHLDALRFEGVPSDSPWPKAARDHWPGGRIWSRVDVTRRAPYVPISEGTFEGWFSNKSRNFRQQMGRARRRISEKGAVLRLLTEGDDVETALLRAAKHSSFRTMR